jgi:hypothetical protein
MTFNHFNFSLKTKNTTIITSIFIFLLIIILPGTSHGILPGRLEPSNRLNVFIDPVWWLDSDFIRQNIPLVNYVRDKELADVHILVTRHDSGRGGTNFFISFIGRRNFLDINYDLSYWAPGNNTADETRKGYTNIIKLGLAPYLSATTLASRVVMNFESVDYLNFQTEEEQVKPSDPWNHWIFEIYGGGNFSQEETRRDVSSRFGFFADRVTADWKFRFRPYFNFREIRFITSSDTIISVSHRHGYESLIVKSVTDHLSVGVFSNSMTSTFHNLNAYIDLAPAIEYSLFPYHEATRRSITFSYRMGYSYSDYIHTTIFAKDQEFLFKHSLEATLRFQQAWGNVRAGLAGSNYFHDISVNRAQIFTNLNLRVFQGFSFNAHINVNLINDLVSVPAGDLSIEEILLMQKQRSTSYSLGGSIGLSYTFGSGFQSAYNPRL